MEIPGIIFFSECGCCGNDDDIDPPIIIDPPDDWDDWKFGKPGYNTLIAIWELSGNDAAPNVLAIVGFQLQWNAVNRKVVLTPTPTRVGPGRFDLRVRNLKVPSDPSENAFASFEGLGLVGSKNAVHSVESFPFGPNWSTAAQAGSIMLVNGVIQFVPKTGAIGQVGIRVQIRQT